MTDYSEEEWEGEGGKLKSKEMIPEVVILEEKNTGKKCGDCGGDIIELKTPNSEFILASRCNKCGKDQEFDDKNED